MMLAPGAINYGDGSQRSIRFNGHSIDDANYTFDGIDNNGVQEQTQKAETRLNIALDSIAEFRVSTAVYTAESGAAGGVQVAPKTGPTIFTAARCTAAQRRARRPVALRRPSIPPFTLHQFGANSAAPSSTAGLLLHELRGPAAGSRQDAVNFVPNAAFARVLGTSPELKPMWTPTRPAGRTSTHHRPDQPGCPEHRTRRFGHDPLRLSLQ
jgi:hypothetical protein